MVLGSRAARNLVIRRRGAAVRTEDSGAVRTVIDAELTVVGDVVTDGAVEIAGRVVGTVNAEFVTVAEGGLVEGTILAESARINGAVEGRVYANTVEIGCNAQVVGNVFHTVLTIEPGAKVEGRRPWRPHIDRRAVSTA